MKVINLFICLICMLLRLHGQTLERQVLANAGSNLQGGEMLLSYTIGESSVSFYEDGLYFASFGFQFPDENALKISTAVSELPNSFLDFLLFPNPVIEKATMYLSSIISEEISITISDVNGKVVSIKSGMTNEETIISFLEFPSGTYFITAETKSGFSQTKTISTI